MINLQEKKIESDQTTNRVFRMGKDEILSLFERYNFQDQIGHPLIYCQDFIELVNRATDSNKQ